MRNDPSRPHGPSWRQPGAGPRNPKAQRDWRQDPTPPPAATRGWSRTTKVRLGVATLLALVVTTVAVILWFRPAHPSTWVLIGNRDWTNLDLPANVAGYKGLVKFADWAHGDTPSPLWGPNLPRLLRGGPVELKSKEDWFAEVNEERKKETTVVLYFSAPGGADGDGPYLFYGDAKPDDERKGRLYVTDILKRLEELPKEKNKVLILDATGDVAGWPFGQLHNDFARGLTGLEDRIRQVPRLVVIGSSGEGQRSWRADAVGETFFSYFLREGMAGKASKGGAVVRAGELFDYVSEQVAHKVRATRLAEQKPILLPKEGGRELAEAIILTRVPDRPHGADEKPTEVNTAAIQKQWEECAKLSQQSPPPYVNHPQRWRQYRALCLRYEELLRAGEGEAARALDEPLARLARELRTPVPAGVTCLENALPLPAALGLAFPRALDEQVRQGWGKLWNASTKEDRQKYWKELRDTVQGGAKDRLAGEEADKILRLRCCGLLLGELVDSKPEAETRAKAGEVLEIITREAGLRPAEAHYLFMALKYLPAEAKPEDLRLAFQTRLAAEEAALALPQSAGTAAYPYSEQVFPWIAEQIRQADEKRRPGEDLLFSSDPEQVKQARENLQAALRAYREARTEGRKVAQALAWRDRLLAVLPDFSRWLAGRFPVSGDNPKEGIDKEVKRVLDLWDLAHHLDDLLKKPDPKLIPDLEMLTTKAGEQFASLTREFNNYCRGLGELYTQPRWHEIEEVLAVAWGDPGLDLKPDLRKALVERHRAIGEQLFHADSPDAGKAVVTPDAVAAAARRGRLAVAALGEQWVQQNRNGSDPGYERLMERVSSPEPGRWQQDLAAPADQIGRLWRQLPREIRKQSAAARESKATLQSAGTALAQADRLCRLLDGPAADRVAGDPAADCRRLQWHNLFVALGRRTAGDQWYGPDADSSRPYYRDAGSKYYQDATNLLAALGGRDGPAKGLLAAAGELKQELDQPSRLMVTGADAVPITSQSRLTLDYGLDGQPGLKPGFAVVRMKTGKLLAPDDERGAQEGRVQPVSPGSGKHQITFHLKKAASAGDADEEKEGVVVEAFYRGQRPRKVTAVGSYPPDTIITLTARPNEAGVAVRTDRDIEEEFQPDRGTLTIIVDYSGSMWDPVSFKEYEIATQARAKHEQIMQIEPQQRPRRIDKALNSLEKVLAELEPGVRLTVRAFSFLGIDQEKKDSADDVTVRLWGPKVWSGKDAVNQVMEKARAKIPWAETPLVRAIYEAHRKDLQGAKGLKTIVVLTDGEDTRFSYTDPETRKEWEDWDLQKVHQVDNLRRGEKYSEFLKREFKDSGVQVNMVFFEGDEGEFGRAQQQFRVIEKLNPPGKIYRAKTVGDLVQRLRKFLHPELRFHLFKQEAEHIGPDEGLEITRANLENLRWASGLDPTSYRITAAKFAQRMELGRGDFVLVNLGLRGFQRGVYARDPSNKFREEPVAKGGWWRGILENKIDPLTGSLSLITTLEKESQALKRADILRQFRPNFLWLKVQGEGITRPQVRWGNLEYYPAPAWHVEVANWAAAAGGAPPPPELSAWWSDEWDLSTCRVGKVLTHTVGAGLDQDFRKAAHGDPDLRGYEILSVEHGFREINKQKENCLLVRVRYPKDKPVLVRVKDLPGVSDQQAQHQFFSQANEYLGIFWPVAQADLDREFSLELISLEKFQKRAEAEGTCIKEDKERKLQTPSERFERPVPVPKKADRAGS